MLRLQPRNKFIQHIETTLKIDWENYFNTIFFSKWFSHWEIICEVLELYWYLVLVIMLVLQVGLSVCLIPTVTWPVTGSVSQPHVVTCWRLFVYNLFVCLFVYLSMCICLYVTIIIILKIIIIFKIFINIILSQNWLQKLKCNKHSCLYNYNYNNYNYRILQRWDWMINIVHWLIWACLLFTLSFFALSWENQLDQNNGLMKT